MKKYRLSAQLIMSNADDQQVLISAVLDVTKLLESLPVLTAGPTWLRNSAIIELYTLSDDRDSLGNFVRLLESKVDLYRPVISSIAAFTTLAEEQKEKTE